MRVIDILRKPSTIQLFFATILIIPFQTALLLPFTMQSFSVLQESPESLFHYDPILIYIYLFLPIIYCIILSLFFRPKRLVSPINIQIGAFVLFSTIIINDSLTKFPLTSNAFENLIFILIFIGFYIIMIGIIQFFIVWWVVGLNYDDTERRSFIINGNPKNIVEKLGRNFKISKNFKVKKEGKDDPIWILKCQDNFKNFVIIAFGSYQNRNDRCVLATVAFHKGVSWVSKSPTATEICNSIINDIKGRLKTANPRLNVTQIDGVDDFISAKAFSYIEAVTQSKIETLIGFFRRISLFFRIAIYITIIAFFVLSFTSYLGYLDVNNYIVAIIPTIILFIIELGVSLREELSIKKVDEFG